MKKRFAFSLLFLFPALGVANVAAPKNVNPEITDIFSSKKNVGSSIIPAEEISPYEMEAGFLYSQGKFVQSGTGEEYDTESAPGKGFYADITRKLGTNFVRMSARITQATFKEPENIGGEEVGVDRQQINLSYGKRYSSFSADAGIGSISQNSDTFTNSQNLLSDYFSLGPSGAIRFEKTLSQSWTFISAASAFVPFMYNERGDQSGSHSFGFYASANALLKVKLNRHLYFNFGATVETEQHEFEGGGDRNVADASLSYTSFLFPAGVSYVF